MSAQDNATKLGKPNQNLVLETAGRIYIKVQDRFYELKFKDLDERIANSSKNTTIINNQIASEPNLDDFVTKKYLKASLDEYVTKRSWNKIKETTSMLENSLLEGFTESINPITINTMQLVVGSEQLQYDFIPDYDDDSRIVPGGFVGNEALTRDHASLTGGWIKHYTLDGPNTVRSSGSWVENNATVDNETELLTQYSRWHIEDGDFNLNEGSYYVYIKVPNLGSIQPGYYSGYPEKDKETGNYYFNATEKFNSSTNTHLQATHSEAQALFVKTNALSIDDTATSSLSSVAGEFVVSQEAIELNQTEDGVEYYYLLYAIINSADDDGYREYSTMNGFTEITPGRVTAYRFMSPDGYQYLNFLDKTFHLGDAALEGEIPVDGPITNTNSYIHWDEINGLIIKGNLKVTGGDLQDVLNMMQSQINGEVRAWFSADNPTDQASLPYDKHCEPTLLTWPANTWNHTDEQTSQLVYDYDSHLGDMYYITDDLQNYDPTDPQSVTYKGQCYRFVKTVTTDNNQEVRYEWVRVNDNALAEVLGKTYENEQAIAGYDYLKEALREGTTNVNGGLVLSSLIQLGNWNRVPGAVDSIDVHAGMNGWVRIEDGQGNLTYRDIAAWYGGKMLDKETYYDWNIIGHPNEWTRNSTNLPQGSIESDIAKTLFRHDGSGYLANGAIFWETDGSLRVPGITLSSNGNITLDSGIIVSGTNTSIGEYDAFFELIDGNLHVKNDRGIYTNGFGSFGGLNPNTSVDVLSSMWTSLTTNSDGYSGRKINALHIPLGDGLEVDTNGNIKVVGGESGGQGTGGVSSITITQGTGITVSNSGTAITTSGTRTISLSNEYITKISNLENRTDWDNYFEIVDNNIHIKNNLGIYTGGFGSFGGLNSNSGNAGVTLERVWQSLDKTYTDSCSSVIDSSFLPIASTSQLGVIKVGTGLSVSNGVLSVTGGGSGNPYTLPSATDGVLGGVKVYHVENSSITEASVSGTARYIGLQIDANGKAFVNVPEYALPYLYVAQTQVSDSSAAGPLLGITGIINTDTWPNTPASSDNLSCLYWDNNNSAWHLRGNFIADGYGSFGGINSNSVTSVSLDRVWQSLKNELTDPHASDLIDIVHIQRASDSQFGVVKIGNGLAIDANTGALYVTGGSSSSGIDPNQIGTGLVWDSTNNKLNLAIADASTIVQPTIGGIIVGNGLSINGSGVTSVTHPFDDYFELVDDDTNLKVIKKNNNTTRGFYNEGFICAGGLAPNQGDMLNRVWQSLDNTYSDTYASRVIDRAHIPTALTNAVGGIIVSNVLNSAVTLTSGDGSTADRYYGVQIDNTGKAFVNVPWSGGSGGAYSGSTYIGIDSSTNVISLNTTALTAYTTSAQDENYKVQIDSGSGGSGGLYVNVPHPNTYIGYTSVTKTQGNTTLLGIDGITNGSSTPTNSDLSWLYWDDTNHAWHLKGNLIADGYGTFGGVNSDAGSTTSLLNVWKSLTNNDNITSSDITSTIKISSSHLDLSGYQQSLGFTLTGTQSSYDLDNMGGGSTYTSGNGISIDASDSNKISVKLNYTTNSGSNVGKYKIENGTYLGNEGLYATIPVYNTRTLGPSITPITAGTTTDRYYGVEINNADNKMFVHVPWENTEYTSKSAAQNGTDISLVTTGEKYTWGNPSISINNVTSGTSSITLNHNQKYKLIVGGSIYIFQTPSDNNYYHTTGDWSGLTYTATNNGTNNDLSFTIPTGTDANSVCVGNDSRLSNSRTPKAHASSATTYGIGTTSYYGHIKLATGDMNGATHVDGVACSKNHTHSQYLTSFTETDPIFTASAAYSISSNDITNWNSKTSLTIGTTASTAAAGNHTHTTSIATSTGTSQISLAHGSKYSITAGGTSYIFTMPESGNTDRYVNTAAFENDNNNSANPVKMTLTRAGSDNSTVTANIPKVSSSSAGVVPKGTSVSTQNQNTKFLREDGSWAKPSYTNYTPGTGIEINNNEIAINSTEVLTPGSSLNAADLTGTIPSGCYTNTTYTFATGDSNGQIKVTPSGGSAQNISVAGLSDLAYISKGSGTTTYLRNDGSWATPPNDNSATLQVGDINNRKINTSETTGSYIKFTGDTNKFTVTDGTKSFDVSITPSISSNVIYSGNLTNGNVPKYSGTSGTIVDSGCKLEQSVLSSSKLTDTTYKLSINNSTNGDNTNGVSLGTIWCATTSGTNDIYSILQSNGESAPTWTNNPNLRGGLTVGYLDNRTNETSYAVEGNVSTNLYGTLTLYKNKALRNSNSKYNFSADPVTLQTMPYQYYPGNGTSNSTNNYGGIYLSISSSVVLSSGKYYDASDIRLKKNIKEITNVLTTIEDLPIVQYEYKSEENHKYIGTLAQKLLPLYPELVIKGGDGYYSVDYGGLAAIAIQGLKELNKRVKYLEDKLYGNNER